MSGRTSMGRSWSILHTFILLFFILDHHPGCNARMWRMTAEMEEVVEVVHSSSLSLLHRRQLQSSLYCVAKPGADSTQLQVALDWACGPTGKVDCTPLQEGGSCYNPNTVADHASYAFNEYYIAQSAATGSCDFNGLATTTPTKPSTSSTCNYPVFGGSTSTSNSTSTSPFTTTPPPPSTSTSNTTVSPGTFDTNSTTGTTSSSTASPITTPWLHALFGGTILIILFLKL